MKTYQKIIGGMVLGGITYLGIQLSDEPTVDCSVATGSLVWNNPDTFDSSEDTVLVLAKKVPLKYYPTDDGINHTPITVPTYINIEVPTKRPSQYGIPDTNLTILEGSIPLDLQYEHDPLAMVIYADTGSSINIVGLDDSTYIFAVFNVQAGIYSNAMYTVGKTIAVDKVESIVLANATRLQWRMPICYDSDTIIAVLSIDSIEIVPTGYASTYLSGINSNYSHNTSYFNKLNGSDGLVMYVKPNLSERMAWSGLPESKMWVFFWVNRGDCWSKATYKEFDPR